MFILLLSIIVASCSEKIDSNVELAYNEEGTIPVRLDIQNLSLNSNLTCELHVFRKSTTDLDYNYWRTVTVQGNNTDTLKFLSEDLASTSYKFLFTCTSLSNEIVTVNSSGSSLDNSNVWGDVRIRQNVSELSKDNYYHVLEKTGQELLQQPQIHATLTRMVGQIVFDIYRIDTDINTPTSIVSADVASVLDRVYKIDIAYTNMSREFYFNASNDLLVDGIENKLQEIEPTLNEDLTLTLPQEDEYLALYDEDIEGAVRIKGLYGFPAVDTVSVKFTFYYYDDTPMCGDVSDTHDHTVACYKTKTLELNIPQNNPSMQYLKILPNVYTVNKVGIKYDRIIDVGVPGSFGFNTEWTNQ